VSEVLYTDPSTCAGFRVGRQLVERYTWDRPRIGTDLDAIKFICKEFWMEVFRKQVRVCAWFRMAWLCVASSFCNGSNVVTRRVR